MTNQLFSVSDMFRDAPASTRIFLVVFITISCFLVFGFIAILLAIPIFGVSLTDINNIIKEGGISTNIEVFKYFQATQSIALFVIPAFILNILLFEPKKRFINNQNKVSYFSISMVLLVILLSLPIIDMLLEWNNMIKLPTHLENKLLELENEASELTDRLLSGTSVTDLLINIFIIALIPALGEEFMFRGVLQKIFHEWTKNIHVAIILSAIIFSAIHMQFYGFIPRFILGLFFGYLFYWGSNIWLAVIAHFFNNLIAVLMNFLTINNIYKLPDFFDDFKNLSPIILLCSLLAISILVPIIRKNISKYSVRLPH